MQGTTQQLLPLEDVKSEVKSEEVEIGTGVEWRTPPESVSARKPQGLGDTANSNESQRNGQPVSGAAGTQEPSTQTQVLGQVAQTLTSLVAQLSAVAGSGSGEQVQPCGQGQRVGQCQGQGQGQHASGADGHLPEGGPGQAQYGALHYGGQGGHPPSGGPGQPPNGDGRGHGFGGMPYGQGSGQGGHGRGNGAGYGGYGVPHMAPFQLPQDMMWYPGMAENVRSVELPLLPGIREGELGGTVVGDWMTMVAPIMRSMSMNSTAWWEAVTRAAGEAYQLWLGSDPVNRLYVGPDIPRECYTTWARVEQRGQSMLLGALPEGLKGEVLSTRSTNTVEILYRIYVRYQPGGLGEKTLLLRQLVDGKTAGGPSEFVEQVRGWKRNLRRAQELNVTTPDPTLLMGALDKMSSTIIKTSSQIAFRLNSTRAQLMVDINPTLASVTNYADAIMGEAEGLLHAGVQTQTTAKVKAIDGGVVEAPAKGDGKGKSSDKPGRTPACKFFGTDDGCKKGQDCTYQHDWSTLDKKGPPRCWTCSSTKHSRRDCTVRAMTTGGGTPDAGGKGKKGGGKGKDGEGAPPTPAVKKADKPEDTSKGVCSDAPASHPGGEGDLGRAAPAVAAHQELLQEATTLLKTLRGPALRAIKLNSLEVQEEGKTLLDGGATHALRTASDLEEWKAAVEVRVELAQGSVTLRQLPWSKTLLSLAPVQSIVPLGILAEIGYAIRWEGTTFELTDPSGCILDTELDGACPTVSETLGLELIKEVERHFIQKRARLAVLRGEGNPGNLTAEHVKELEEIRMMFPLIPEEILVRVLPRRDGRDQWREGDLPWNRHRRRRLRKASQVIIHLFSGKDENFWRKELENQHRAVLCLDMELDQRQNLLRDDIMEFLMELADSGRAVAWLGGPPCRTMSRLRYRQPGPPPLRSREGAERFGLHGLDESLKKRVIDDTILWLRQYYLYHRAKKVSQQKVLYLSEQPEDPENYLEEEMIKKQRYPSYWAFPEWKWMKETNDFIEVHFDQGRTGHIKRKPTTLGTNIYELQHLQGLRGPGSSREGGADELTVEQRIQLSRTWAAWSPGLKNAIVTAVKNELDGRIKRLTLEQWKAHLLNDHQPYYRGCRTCLEACGQSRHHRRVVTPDSYTLAIDLAGPFKKGEDQLGHGRYMLVGSFTVPVSKDGRALHLKTEEEDSAHRCGNPRVEGGRFASAASGAEDDDHPGGEGRPIPAPGPIEGGIFNDPDDPEEVQQHEAGDDPLLEEDDQMASLTKDEKKDDTEEWKRKIEEEQNFEVKQITLVEILPDRSGPAVISGLSRMHARLRYLGLPLLRLHSDRAGELRSKTIRKWAEDRKIYRTYTDGDSYKSNGRAEGDINMIKKQVRTLLKETGFEASLWPLAARHAAERRMRLQLEALQCPTRPILQFGREAYAMQKIWNEKYQDWKMTRRRVTIMGPDVAMSASMPGYYVRGEDGKYFHSSDVVTAEGPPPEAQLEEAELGLLQDHGGRRRITGKTTMLSTLRADENSQVAVSEIEQRRLRGLQLLMEELDIQDTDLDQSAESSTEDEKTGSDRFIRALLTDVEGLADQLIEVEQDHQHQETVDIELAAENQEVFLQTRMFSLAEVKANLAEWIPSMKSELDSLMIETGAIKEITWKEADRLRREAESKGVLFEKIPAKAVFSRKAGSGKRKCRACACGNYMAQRDQLDTYAGGTGATEVRTALRKAGLEGWSAVALDVKTAFLRAPRDHSREIVVVQPPAIFVLAGLCGPDTLWLVEKALYGLTTSPKEWTQFRNQSLGDFRWHQNGCIYEAQKTNDQDIWKIVALSQSPAEPSRFPRGGEAESTMTDGKTVGLFVTYVDDILAVGEKEVLQGFCTRMKEEWEVGAPDWVTPDGPSVRFLGMEIELKDQKFRIHQRAYIQNLLEKYPHEKPGSLASIRPPEPEDHIDPKECRLPNVRLVNCFG